MQARTLEKAIAVTRRDPSRRRCGRRDRSSTAPPLPPRPATRPCGRNRQARRSRCQPPPSTMSPVRRFARRAGPLSDTLATTILSSISVALRPSHGRGGWLGRPDVSRSCSIGFKRSIGTIMLSGSGAPLSRTCCTCSEPMPSNSPATADHRGAAPERMRGRGKNCLVEDVFPIAGEFLLGHDPRRDRMPASARRRRPPRSHPTSHSSICRSATRATRSVRAPEPFRSRSPGRRRAHDRYCTAIAEMQPDRLSLGDEVAYGEHDAVSDQDTVSRPLGPQRFGGEGICGNNRPESYRCRQRLVEIEGIILRLRLRSEGISQSPEDDIRYSCRPGAPPAAIIHRPAARHLAAACRMARHGR